MAQLDFSDYVVIVTGAGRGIGRAHAELLADRGAAVVVNDTGGAVDGSLQGADPAGEVVEAITASGGRAVASTASVATEQGARAIVETAIASFGKLDAVVNNAGIYSVRSLHDITEAECRSFQDVHYFGSLFVSQAAWPHLAASKRGRIVNTISGAMLGVPDMVHYGAAKGAVFGLTRNLAVAGHADGIKVNAIAPGAGTRMVELATDALPPGMAAQMRESMPPRLVAPVAAYLAHERCTLSGEALSVAGGRVRRIAFGYTRGITDAELTPEIVADRLDEILHVGEFTPEPLMLPREAVS
ncbi:SDR family NAD(P)-dependent oxidoreductase [Nocardia cerradoensis]|uniref:Putative short-chain type dehydrogenase/reductase n=1 Tax=Nocardia cerradoensis TaxID=85688 RepID=A0A231GV27_9NOCA|nr:SDR family NAD(P)-dependent oxidoreductase [Nocardia cerradoensis]NKY43639.1 SDR family NAD(P)-dependent oxidoreductase [Nocardia cerradoensis]OXR40432.1 putative short-chain type dehydrogenase/reductase [Nocardia cerradoensis]